jgi:hypothetical protein
MQEELTVPRLNPCPHYGRKVKPPSASLLLRTHERSLCMKSWHADMSKDSDPKRGPQYLKHKHNENRMLMQIYYTGHSEHAEAIPSFLSVRSI